MKRSLRRRILFTVFARLALNDNYNKKERKKKASFIVSLITDYLFIYVRLWDVAGIINITVLHIRADNDTATK